jgi:hypothetical protein
MRVVFVAAVLFMTGIGLANAAVVKVEAWCPITGAKGFGSASTFELAKGKAIHECLAHGGLAKCCYKFYRQVS